MFGFLDFVKKFRLLRISKCRLPMPEEIAGARRGAMPEGEGERARWAIKRAGSRLSKGAGEAKLKHATIAKLPEALKAQDRSMRAAAMQATIAN